MSQGNSRKVVIAALTGNLLIAACKFFAAYASHSTATLAEAVHSLADTGNQALLLYGMHLASRPAGDTFAFGRASENYFWPFIVALVLFSLGGGFAVLEGLEHIAHPPSETPAATWSFVVLGVSLVIEGASFRVAWREFQKASKGVSWRAALLETKNPTIALVLAEDVTAIAGLLIALMALLAAQVTGQYWWDPVGSVVIGILLSVVAFTLARITHRLLIGESATRDDELRAARLAAETPGVDRVTQLLTMHLGPEDVILAMKIAFRRGMPVEELEETTDEIERHIRADLPHMRKIFIEADSRGDGRGLPECIPADEQKTAKT